MFQFQKTSNSCSEGQVLTLISNIFGHIVGLTDIFDKEHTCIMIRFSFDKGQIISK